MKAIFILICCVGILQGQPVLKVPGTITCGRETILTCITKDAVAKWTQDILPIVTNGQPQNPVNPVKYKQTTTNSSVQLSIRNTVVSDNGRYRCHVGFTASNSETVLVDCRPTLQVPSAGNCGDDTVLTCETNGTVASWRKDNSIIVSNGNPVNTVTPVKYKQTTTNTSVVLTIINTQITDVGDYRCSVRFDLSDYKTLGFECKANTVNTSISKAKILSLSIKDVYPSPQNIGVQLEQGSSLEGSFTCNNRPSFTIVSYYKCVWTGTDSLEDGEYNYYVTVTTLTHSDPLEGWFKIVTPGAPTISNIELIVNNTEAIRATEGEVITLTCTSSDGIPVPVVFWYRDNLTTTPLASVSNIIKQQDGTYTLVLIHTFIAGTTDDRASFICRSFYPLAGTTATQGSRHSSVLTYLTSAPGIPKIFPVSNITTTSVTVSWIQGFHGGFDQIFFVQWSDDNLFWHNKSIAGGQSTSNKPFYKVLDNLVPQTLYYIKMYAYNHRGQSQETAYIQFFTANEDVIPVATKESPLVGVIGGTAGGVFVVLVIVILIVLIRKNIIMCRVQCGRKTEGSRRHDENERHDKDVDIRANTSRQTGSCYNTSKCDDCLNTVNNPDTTPNKDTVADIDKSVQYYTSLTERDTLNTYDSLRETEMMPITSTTTTAAVTSELTYENVNNI